MLELLIDQSKSLNILCLGAHCDDIEIGAGGTLLKFIKKYQIGSVKWVVFASDEIRRKEAVTSAEKFLKEVNQTDISIKSYRDGFLPFIAGEIKDYFEVIKREFQPDIIFTHYRNDRHQDHRLISDLAWNTWRNHLILEYEVPKYDGDLGIPNFYVPIEKELIQRKNSIIIDSFRSQKNKHWFDNETFTALPRLRGMESSSLYAEAFYARKIVL